MVPAGGQPIKRRKWDPAIAANLLVAAMFAAAVIPGVLATRTLLWPYDLDHFRDIASAYTMQDGGGLEDPLYAGERAWYNPLVPALVALIAGVLHAPVPETLARAGAWINALPPIVFLLCARRVIGPIAALPAIGAFLFLPRNIPPWAASTYTPWLFPAVTAHALFYAGLLLWLRALAHPSPARLLLAGVTVGVTMLAHTGSALVLAGIIVVTAALIPERLSPIGARGRRGRLIAILLPGTVAAIVAAPFLLPLVTRYGLHVVNRAPGAWIEERLLFGNLPGLLKPTALPTAALVTIGAVHLARQGLTRTNGLLLAWAGVAATGFVYSTFAQSSQTLPTIVSSYHFYFLLRALSCLAFGAGFAAIARAIAARRPSWSAATVTIVVTFVLAASLYPGYLKRPALTIAPYAARHVGAQTDDRDASIWIRAHITRDAVFLAYDDDAMRIVGAGGRKALCVDAFFSNPYVDRQPRTDARDRLIEAMLAGNREAFRAIAARWGITHVLYRPSLFPTLARTPPSWLHPLYQRPDIVVAHATP